MTDLFNLLLVPVGGVLWYLGGYGCGDDGIPDEGLPNLRKAWRRWVWPLIVGIYLLCQGIPFLRLTTIFSTLVVALHLGYGEDYKWWQRAVVGFLLGVPIVLVDWNWIWPIATLLTFIPMYWLSRRYTWMDWRVVEAATGAVQAVCFVLAVR
jgi:hypothetical protein